MVKIEKTKDIYSISNGIYSCNLSISRGGSMVAMAYNGVNTMLKREGCEYWGKEDHYEQEFGGDGIITVAQDEDGARILVESCLGSPITKVIGGQCSVEWHFDDTPIIKSIGSIIPNHKIVYFDRYVCFLPKSYRNYFVRDAKSEYMKKIGTPKKRPWEIWFRNKGPGVVGLTNTQMKFRFGFKESPITTVFHSATMIEIKTTFPTKSEVDVEFSGEYRQ